MLHEGVKGLLAIIIASLLWGTTGVTASYTPGYGGGIDKLYIPNVTLDQLIPLRQANDLWISSMADASDGQITEGVVISNFFLGGIYTIEYLETQDYILSLSDYFGVV